MDVEKALASPADVFTSPEAVLEAAGLTHQQKCQALRQWAYDLRELLVATDENMDAEHDTGVAADELGRVERLLAELEPANDSASAPTRQGGA